MGREQMSRRREISGRLVVFAICVGTPLLVGAVGGLFTQSSVDTWYQELERPSFTPPGWLFGPVWTGLYVLMGVAAYIVWRNGWALATVRVALLWFLAQLVFNGLWSPVFFGLRSPVGGLVVIVPLLLAIVATVRAFWRVSPLAAGLLVPYLLWTAFAAVLNAAIAVLNG